MKNPQTSQIIRHVVFNYETIMEIIILILKMTRFFDYRTWIFITYIKSLIQALKKRFTISEWIQKFFNKYKNIKTLDTEWKVKNIVCITLGGNNTEDKTKIA